MIVGEPLPSSLCPVAPPLAAPHPSSRARPTAVTTQDAAASPPPRRTLPTIVAVGRRLQAGPKIMKRNGATALMDLF